MLSKLNSLILKKNYKNLNFHVYYTYIVYGIFAIIEKCNFIKSNKLCNYYIIYVYIYIL